MSTKIAILLGEDNKAATIYESGTVKVYAKEDQWKVVNDIGFDINADQGMANMHRNLEEFIKKLDDCKVFIAKTVEGVPYTVLKKSGFTIAEAEGEPNEFLDEFLEIFEEKRKKKLEEEKAKDIDMEPVELDTPGNFFLDLKKILQQNPDMSSKKVLLPFLNNKTFYEIKVRCNHIPPWFKGELESLNMKMESNKIDDDTYEVTISHKVCNECK